MGEKVSLFICDDSDDYRRLLKDVFGAHAEIAVVGEASEGRAAIVKCAELRPDVILMDLNMRPCSGLTAMEQILKENKKTRVLIHSGSTELGDVERCLTAGASGYLAKGCSITELYAAVLALAKGGIYPDPQIVETFVLAA